MSGASILLLLTLVVLPVVSSRSLRGQAGLIRENRTRFYAVGMGMQWLLTAICFLVVWGDDLLPADIGFRATDQLGTLVALGLGVTGALAALILLLLWLQTKRGWPETDELTAILPETRREKLLFLAVAVTAGFCEEALYRGFAITRLATVAGGVWSAAIVSTVIFSVGHVYQGAVGMLRAGALGAILALMFVWTGSLLPGMIAHFLLDVLGGLWGRAWLEKDRRRPGIDQA
jgi:membrane protease YdiL (CAAX protease family)